MTKKVIKYSKYLSDEMDNFSIFTPCKIGEKRLAMTKRCTFFY